MDFCNRIRAELVSRAEATDPLDTHRHVSHLFALHPGRQISPHQTPELAVAARKLSSATLRSVAGSGKGKVRYGDQVSEVSLKPGESLALPVKRW